MFSCRIVSTDHYQARPIRNFDVSQSEFRNAQVYQVPVLRLYGVTPSGQKTCMHMHGIFPYLYVPYDGGNDSDKYMRQFASSVDKALNVAMGKPSSNNHHVYKICLVSGKPFYGYYTEKIPFMKIYLYNPLMVKKVADLLCGGAIMNKVYQPYEAHIPYHLQIFIDYNLYGMNMINVAAVKFRRPSDEAEDDNRFTPPTSPGMGFDSASDSQNSEGPSFIVWNRENISPELWLDKDITRQSTCELEVDIVAADILNRYEVGDNIGSNPGLAALWEDERQRRRERGSSQDLEPPASPDRGLIPMTDAEIELQERLEDIIHQLQPFVSDEGSETGSQADESQIFTNTPASSVDIHLSQSPNDDDNLSGASQNTVILEEEEAIVNARSILQVVASSQSFRQERELLQLNPSPAEQLDTTQDKDLAAMLANLLDDEEVTSSQEVLTQLSAQALKLEEQDSILSQVCSGGSTNSGTANSKGPTVDEANLAADGDNNDETETLEMSQLVWHSEDDQDVDEQTDEKRAEDAAAVDITGLDCSWNSSQLQDIAPSTAATTASTSSDHVVSSKMAAKKIDLVLTKTFGESDDSDIEMSDIIPQLDGTGDTKKASVPPKKRPGMRGPVLESEEVMETKETTGSPIQDSENTNDEANDDQTKTPVRKVPVISPTRPRSNRASKSKCVAFLKDVTTSKKFQLDQYKKFPDSISTTKPKEIPATPEESQESPGKRRNVDTKKGEKDKTPVLTKKLVKGRKSEHSPESDKTEKKTPKSERNQNRLISRTTRGNVEKMTSKNSTVAVKKVLPKRGAKTDTVKTNAKKKVVSVSAPINAEIESPKKPVRRKSTKPAKILPESENSNKELNTLDTEQTSTENNPDNHVTATDVPIEDTSTEKVENDDQVEEDGHENENDNEVDEEDDDDKSGAQMPELSDISDADDNAMISSPLIVRRRGSSDSSGADDSYDDDEIAPTWLVGPHRRTYGQRSYRPGSTSPPPSSQDVDQVFGAHAKLAGNRTSQQSGEQTPNRDRSPRRAGSRSPRTGSRSPRMGSKSPRPSSKSPRRDERSPRSSKQLTPNDASPTSKQHPLNTTSTPPKQGETSKNTQHSDDDNVSPYFSSESASNRGSGKRKGGSPRRLSVEKRPVPQPKYSDISDDEDTKPNTQTPGDEMVKRHLNMDQIENKSALSKNESDTIAQEKETVNLSVQGEEVKSLEPQDMNVTLRSINQSIEIFENVPGTIVDVTSKGDGNAVVDGEEERGFSSAAANQPDNEVVTDVNKPEPKENSLTEANKADSEDVVTADNKNIDTIHSEIVANEELETTREQDPIESKELSAGYRGKNPREKDAENVQTNTIDSVSEAHAESMPAKTVDAENLNTKPEIIENKTSQETASKVKEDTNQTENVPEIISDIAETRSNTEEDLGPPMLDMCEQNEELSSENFKDAGEEKTEGSSVDDNECPVLERIDLKRSETQDVPQNPGTSKLGKPASQLSRALEAAYNQSVTGKSQEQSGEESLDRSQDQFESNVDDHTGCDDFPVLFDASQNYEANVKENAVQSAVNANKTVKKPRISHVIDVKRVRRGKRKVVKKILPPQEFHTKRENFVKTGGKFKADKHALENLKADILRIRNVRLPEETICFPYESEIKYLNSQSTKGSKNASDKFREGSVRVLKADCREFDLREIGTESLVIPFLSEKDIKEMQEQVKLEVAHRLKETNARKIQLAKPLTVPSHTYKDNYNFYSSDALSYDGSDKEDIEKNETAGKTGKEVVNDEEKGQNQMKEIGINKKTGNLSNGEESKKQFDATSASNQLEQEETGDSISQIEEPALTENSVADDNSVTGVLVFKASGKRRGKKAKRTTTRAVKPKLEKTTNEDPVKAAANVVENDGENVTKINVGTVVQETEGKAEQQRRKKKWRSEAERLADDSTIKLSQEELGRKRERRKTTALKELEKEKQDGATGSENDEEEEEYMSELDFASDDSDKDVSFQPPTKVDSRQREPKIQRFRPPKPEKPPKPERVPKQRKVRVKKEKAPKPPKLTKEKQYLDPSKYCTLPGREGAMDLIQTKRVKHQDVNLRQLGLRGPSTTGQVVQHFFSMPAPKALAQPLRKAPKFIQYFQDRTVPMLRQQQQDSDDEFDEEGEEYEEDESSDEEPHQLERALYTPRFRQIRSTPVSQSQRSPSPEDSSTRIDLRGFSSFSAAPVFKQVEVKEVPEVDAPAIKCIPMSIKGQPPSDSEFEEEIEEHEDMNEEYEEMGEEEEMGDYDGRLNEEFDGDEHIQREIDSEDAHEEVLHPPVLKPQKPIVITPSPAVLEAIRIEKQVKAKEAKQREKIESKIKATSYDFDEAEFAVPDVEVPDSPTKRTFERAKKIKSEKKERKSKEFNELFGDDITKVITIKVSQQETPKPAPPPPPLAYPAYPIRTFTKCKPIWRKLAGKQEINPEILERMNIKLKKKPGNTSQPSTLEKQPHKDKDLDEENSHEGHSEQILDRGENVRQKDPVIDEHDAELENYMQQHGEIVPAVVEKEKTGKGENASIISKGKGLQLKKPPIKTKKDTSSYSKPSAIDQTSKQKSESSKNKESKPSSKNSQKSSKIVKKRPRSPQAEEPHFKEKKIPKIAATEHSETPREESETVALEGKSLEIADKPSHDFDNEEQMENIAKSPVDGRTEVMEKETSDVAQLDIAQENKDDTMQIKANNDDHQADDPGTTTEETIRQIANLSQGAIPDNDADVRQGSKINANEAQEKNIAEEKEVMRSAHSEESCAALEAESVIPAETPQVFTRPTETGQPKRGPKPGHEQMSRTKGDENLGNPQDSPRRVSTDNIRPGVMAEVDFSVMDLMDTDENLDTPEVSMENLDQSDSHRQLHTPPLVIENAAVNPEDEMADLTEATSQLAESNSGIDERDLKKIHETAHSLKESKEVTEIEKRQSVSISSIEAKSLKETPKISSNRDSKFENKSTTGTYQERKEKPRDYKEANKEDSNKSPHTKSKPESSKATKSDTSHKSNKSLDNKDAAGSGLSQETSDNRPDTQTHQPMMRTQDKNNSKTKSSSSAAKSVKIKLAPNEGDSIKAHSSSQMQGHHPELSPTSGTELALDPRQVTKARQPNVGKDSLAESKKGEVKQSHASKTDASHKSLHKDDRRDTERKRETKSKDNRSSSNKDDNRSSKSHSSSPKDKETSSNKVNSEEYKKRRDSSKTEHKSERKSSSKESDHKKDKHSDVKPRSSSEKSSKDSSHRTDKHKSDHKDNKERHSSSGSSHKSSSRSSHSSSTHERRDSKSSSSGEKSRSGDKKEHSSKHGSSRHSSEKHRDSDRKSSHREHKSDKHSRSPSSSISSSSSSSHHSSKHKDRDSSSQDKSRDNKESSTKTSSGFKSEGLQSASNLVRTDVQSASVVKPTEKSEQIESDKASLKRKVDDDKEVTDASSAKKSRNDNEDLFSLDIMAAKLDGVDNRDTAEIIHDPSLIIPTNNDTHLKQGRVSPDQDLLPQETETADMDLDHGDNISVCSEDSSGVGSPSKSTSGSKKKRKLPNRMDSAFCKPSGVRARKRTEKKKFRDTLSLMHQVTLDNLSSKSEDSPCSSEFSNEQALSLMDISSANTTETRAEKTNIEAFSETRHNGQDENSADESQYGVMHKLAYLSPVCEHGSLESPPTALSPNFHKIVDTSELYGLNDQIKPFDKDTIKSSTYVLGKFENRPLPANDTRQSESESTAFSTKVKQNASLQSSAESDNLSPVIPRMDRKHIENDIENSENITKDNMDIEIPSSPHLETPLSPPSSPPSLLTHAHETHQSQPHMKEIPMTPQDLQEGQWNSGDYTTGLGYGQDMPGTPVCDEREMPDIRFDTAPASPETATSASLKQSSTKSSQPYTAIRSPSPIGVGPRSPSPARNKEKKQPNRDNPIEIPLTLEEEIIMVQEKEKSKSPDPSLLRDTAGVSHDDRSSALDRQERSQSSKYQSVSTVKSEHDRYRESYSTGQHHRRHTSQPYDYGEGSQSQRNYEHKGSRKSSSSSRSSQGHSSRSSHDDFSSGNSYSGKSDSRERHREHPGAESSHRKYVITPLKPPPGAAKVVSEVVARGMTSQQGAYCSNPQDIPSRPRELGGKVLKVQTSLMSELNEYTCRARGLRHWLEIEATSQLEKQMSQAASVEVVNQFRNQPQMQTAMFGDRSMVIMPAKGPPSLRSVKKYIEGRKLYKQAKNQQKSAKEKSDQTHKAVIVVPDETEKDNNKPRSKETGFRPISPAMSPEMKSTQSQNVISPKSPVFTSSAQPLKSPPIIIIDDDDDIDSMTSPKNVSSPTGDASFVASTPAMPLRRKSSLRSAVKSIKKSSTPRRVSFEADYPPLTPIHKPKSQDENTQANSKQYDHAHEVKDSGSEKRLRLASQPLLQTTPSASQRLSLSRVSPISGSRQSPVPGTSGFSSAKPGARIQPSRRTSTGPDSLRRILMSSQLKNQFGTPPPSGISADASVIEGPTPKNTYGFRVNSQCVQDAKALHEYQHITVLSLELHMSTRGDYRPDPEMDEIAAIFYSIFHDIPPENGPRHITGVICVHTPSANAQENQERITDSAKRIKLATENQPASQKGSQHAKQNASPTMPSTSQMQLQMTSPQPSTSKAEIKDMCDKQAFNKGSSNLKLYLHNAGLPNIDVTYARDEKHLLELFTALIRKWDPDMLLGYETEMLSWGFLIQRASHLSINLRQQISRIPGASKEKNKEEKVDSDASYVSGINIPGRILLNLWTIAKHEVTLNVYSFENVCFHVLHKRIPLYSFRLLHHWFQHRTHLYRWRTIEHYIIRAKANIQILEQLDLIGQTSEFARVFGIEFYHVLSRGSQYRVESMMLRIAKPMDFIPVSPSVQQRAHMKAPECIPLTLEPESALYTDPVIVLDFQSLYPSIMIAHNYCYSTCLGRIDCLAKANEGPFPFGCTSLDVHPLVLQKLKEDITICPNGVCFVRKHIHKGILPTMVGDILKTRLMVKKSMKDYKDDKTLQRLLHARQLSLKLIANVTFGYTSANFSGRMPAMEIGDSIVRKARETLERAIALVEQTPKWSARVVYGDTDSMFILLKGRNKDEAFTIGQEIADAVTADNPKPIKLKFEKVYLPCVLQTKKRYVGFMYETRDQKEPVFDAKGIETVRRDTCTAVSKVLEKSIKILFNSKDVSLVKSYVQKQCKKLLEGRFSIQDCVFAKEYRGIAGYKPGACVPALAIARRNLAKDRRSEPRVGERVPYVIVYGTPGLPLIQLVRQPLDVVNDASLRINAHYYISKQVLPPLNRMFSLFGVDVFAWYQELPRVIRTQPQIFDAGASKKADIAQYFHSMNCPVCDEMTQRGMCGECKTDPQRRAVILATRIRQAENSFFSLYQICSNCMGTQDRDAPCISLDCPVMYKMAIAKRKIGFVPTLYQLQDKHLTF